MPKLTITEIAQLAGVSIGTVSRALNGRQGVSPKTRENVLEIVKQTGFVPDLGARRLARGTQQLVGVAPFSDNAPRSPYYAYLLDAIQESLYQRGFVARVIDPTDNEATRDCTGFIVPGVHLDDPRVASLKRRKIAVVIVGQGDEGTAWVDVDNRGGMQFAVQHLIKLGHRRIAHLTGSPIGQTSQHRLEAFQQTLEQNGLKFEPDLLLDGGFTDLGAYRTIRHAVKQAKGQAPFTALCSASDEMATGAIQALEDFGLRVPRDVSITGFDDLPFARHMRPALTTVRQPIRDLGHIAADLLLEQLEGKAERQVLLPTELVARASSGPAAQ